MRSVRLCLILVHTIAHPSDRPDVIRAQFAAQILDMAINHAIVAQIVIIPDAADVVLGVMLCRFHPLTDKVGVLVHKVYDALVIFGVLVVLAVALHHFEGSQVHLYGFNNLIANPCR